MNTRSILPLIALVAAGCGGGNVANVKSAALKGRVAVRVAFPSQAARVIPSAAQSVKVQIVQNATVVNEAILTPSAPATTFNDVLIGPISVKAVAYPTATATGTPLATAQSDQTVSEGVTSNVGLTMASTIDHLVLTPNPFHLRLLPTVLSQQAVVTAYDASGSVVLTSPTDMTYSTGSSGVGLFIVNPATGMVTGVTVGSGTLTVTDSVSGKSASAPVNVTLL